jgi:hypothetical protein
MPSTMPNQLRKCHRQILVLTGEAALSGVSVVTRHAAAELAIGKEADQLGEDGPAFVHSSLLPLRPNRISGFAQFKSRQIQIARNSQHQNHLSMRPERLAGQ